MAAETLRLALRRLKEEPPGTGLHRLTARSILIATAVPLEQRGHTRVALNCIKVWPVKLEVALVQLLRLHPRS